MLEKKSSRLLPNSPSVLTGGSSFGGLSITFPICVLALTLAYRIQLTVGLFASSVKPFDFNPSSLLVWFMIPYWRYDLAVVLVSFLLAWTLSKIELPVAWTRTLEISGVVLLHLAVILLILVYGIHLRLLFTVQTGLDLLAIREGFSSVPLGETVKLANAMDFFFLFLPLGFLWLVLLSPAGVKTWMGRVSLALIIFLTLASVLATNRQTKDVPDEIKVNPALFLLSDVAACALKQAAGDHRQGATGTQGSGIRLRTTMYDDQVKSKGFFPPKKDRPWNIVFFVMESVGTRYIFDTNRSSAMPMAFLYRMSKESWHLKKHYTTSNVSTKALFSLLSGLYDFFGRENFGTLPDANVPWMYNFLAKGYDSFLVTPSPLTWYFPMAVVKNSGLPEIHSFENLSLKKKEEFHSLGHYIARDEVETIEFFMRRLDQAREPFVGIYISFAAHFPYFDYGPEYHLTGPEAGLVNRYYNNLYLLDRMIRRIYEHIEKRGLLERTIFVVVGDHGQAFGQHHPNNYMHYRYSYNENLETPAFIYQPRLFRPKAFEITTSHVDLLPTLLDAMRIPHDAFLFDGESLFHQPLRRKYIFFYGLEESISCIDNRQIKVQVSLKENRCRAFDLEADPEEKNLLDCSSYQSQLEALRNFVGHHDSSLVQYNSSFRKDKAFEGQKHPSVPTGSLTLAR